jgi:hypothetical protein
MPEVVLTSEWIEVAPNMWRSAEDPNSFVIGRPGQTVEDVLNDLPTEEDEG